jgi:hypothetical protein
MNDWPMGGMEIHTHVNILQLITLLAFIKKQCVANKHAASREEILYDPLFAKQVERKIHTMLLNIRDTSKSSSD